MTYIWPAGTMMIILSMMITRQMEKCGEALLDVGWSAEFSLCNAYVTI
jgi:hypothetical protein